MSNKMIKVKMFCRTTGKRLHRPDLVAPFADELDVLEHITAIWREMKNKTGASTNDLQAAYRFKTERLERDLPLMLLPSQPAEVIDILRPDNKVFRESEEKKDDPPQGILSF